MVQIPIIHIADATADELEKSHIRRVGLLGTKYTMTQDFYKNRLADRGIEVLIRQSDVSTPLFDTTGIHAKKAAQIAMED